MWFVCLTYGTRWNSTDNKTHVGIWIPRSVYMCALSTVELFWVVLVEASWVLENKQSTKVRFGQYLYIYVLFNFG